MWLEDQGIQATHLIYDRDTKFTKAFDQLMRSAEIKIVKSPVKAPNANAFAEAWIAALKRECLDHFVCFSLGHADYITQTFVGHYNENRPHQGIGNMTLKNRSIVQNKELEETGPLGCIECRSGLGGLLKHYSGALLEPSYWLTRRVPTHIKGTMKPTGPGDHSRTT